MAETKPRNVNYWLRWLAALPGGLAVAGVFVLITVSIEGLFPLIAVQTLRSLVIPGILVDVSTRIAPSRRKAFVVILAAIWSALSLVAIAITMTATAEPRGKWSLEWWCVRQVLGIASACFTAFAWARKSEWEAS